MHYLVVSSKKFKRQYRKLRKSNIKLFNSLNEVIDLLAEREALPVKNHNHKLSNSIEDYWECHISPDWLLIYSYHNSELILELMATGSHSELF